MNDKKCKYNKSCGYDFCHGEGVCKEFEAKKKVKRINSKQKGASGERELAKILREHGYECRRSQQYAGGTEESADIIGLPHIHIECKRVEKLNIDDAMEQAHNDAMEVFKDCIKLTKLSAVFHRRNGKEWKVTMYLDDWMNIYKEYEAGKSIQPKEFAGQEGWD
jgi:Holliday junction resolvase